MKILIDFVPGAHGHFLEIILNKFFHAVPVNFNPFTKLGTSHQGLDRDDYNRNKLFFADHWSELSSDELLTAKYIISIKFEPKDLLLLSSISLLRAGDVAIDNDELEIDTYNKLNNRFYKSTLEQLISAYPFLNINRINSSVPRNVLREFYKYSFVNTEENGYWKRQQTMIYPNTANVFNFEFDAFYDVKKFEQTIKDLELFVGKSFDFDPEFYSMYYNFVNGIKYKNCQQECDVIIDAVISGRNENIPKLTLLQESYINAQLEKYFKKEMPFQQLNYFKNTKDVLQYLETEAPIL